MRGRKLCYAFFALVLLAASITVAGDGIKPAYKPTQKAYYLTQAQVAFVRPGLNLKIQKVEYAPPAVKVTFQITDDAGQGLDRLGIQTPGPVSTSFVLARIKPGDTQYTNYFTKPVAVPTSPNIDNCAACSFTGATADQPTTDSGGTYEDLGNGVYTYTFGNQLPADFDVDSTNTVGMYARRDLSAFGFPLNSIGTVANATLDFVPSGAPVTQVRDVVRTAACNQCHDPLAVHGGSRQDVRLCILCHNPGNTDPYTGNALDFKVFIHKIHMGANLPSVTGKPLNILGLSGSGTSTTATGQTEDPLPAGATAPATPYQIIGYRNSVNDFSTVVWPQDVRNCTTCHQGGTQSDNYKTKPSRAACGSCHDNVNFATGENHPGGVQVDDSMCSTCHPPDTGLEFDLSVVGAHTMPWKSKQLAGLNVDITDVTNANPGQNPTVNFNVTDNAGDPVDITTLGRLALTIAGPTTDYTTDPPWQEDARSATAGPTGYTYTLKSALPADASGTWAVGAEANRTVTITGPLLGQSFNVRETAFNPVFYFGISGSQVVPRRTVVDIKNCNVCHNGLAKHGANRRNTQYCILCHNPKHGDGQTPPETVNFRTFIHRIHMGDKLDSTFTAGGGPGEEHTNWNGVRFPGDQRDCAKCHVGTTYTVPLPDGLVPTDEAAFFYTPLQPTASACLGCHNGEDAAAHAYQMTSPFGESCPVCHEEGADWAVTKVHAR